MAREADAANYSQHDKPLKRENASMLISHQEFIVRSTVVYSIKARASREQLHWHTFPSEHRCGFPKKKVFAKNARFLRLAPDSRFSSSPKPRSSAEQCERRNEKNSKLSGLPRSERLA